MTKLRHIQTSKQEKCLLLLVITLRALCFLFFSSELPALHGEDLLMILHFPWDSFKTHGTISILFSVLWISAATLTTSSLQVWSTVLYLKGQWGDQVFLPNLLHSKQEVQILWNNLRKKSGYCSSPYKAFSCVQHCPLNFSQLKQDLLSQLTVELLSSLFVVVSGILFSVKPAHR